MSINRRELLSGLAVASVAAGFPGLGFSEVPAGLCINPDRLRESLEGLSVYGRPEGGTFADGVTRDGFSDACVEGRKYAMRLMRGFGMEPRVDPAGNIFGARAGSDRGLKPILFGSHIDSVPSGGNFDGDLGSMSAIEVMHALKEHGVTTRHPLQMVIWTDEENTFTGSGSAAGVLQTSNLSRMRNGLSLADGLRKLGGDPARLAEARLSRRTPLLPGIAYRAGRHLVQGECADRRGARNRQHRRIRCGDSRLCQPCGNHSDEGAPQCSAGCGQAD